MSAALVAMSVCNMGLACLCLCHAMMMISKQCRPLCLCVIWVDLGRRRPPAAPLGVGTFLRHLRQLLHCSTWAQHVCVGNCWPTVATVANCGQLWQLGTPQTGTSGKSTEMLFQPLWSIGCVPLGITCLFMLTYATRARV